jgi:glycosyltransferase EpsH
MKAMRIMMDYAKENGALEEFKDVIEYHFSNLFYRNTLFSYMQSDCKTDWKLLKSMGKEMLETFPDFRQNSYYNQTVNEYEQKLINIHLKSTFAFLVIYRLKMLSKKIKGIKKNK